MASTPLADRAYSVLNNAFASHASLAALDSGSLRIQCLSCGRAATDGDCDCDSSESSDDDDERATTCSSSAPFRLIAVSLEAHRSSAPPQPQRVRIVHADLGLCLGVSKCRRRVELQPLVTEDEGQHWLLCPVKSASTIWHAFHYTQSSFIIASSKRPNLVLDVDRSDGSILLYAEHGGDNQQFSFQSVRAASRTQPCSLPHAVIAACTAGDISQLGALLESESVHMACMRSELDALLGGAPNASDASSSSSSSSASGSTGYEWLSANRRALECFLSSGGCTKAHDGSEYARVPRVERWRNAIAILSAILARFPDVAAAASEDATYDSAALPQPPLPLLQRMAIATALAFSSGVPCHAGLAVGLIEPVGRFALFREWVELGILFPDFHDLSAWHLRYVLGSWATNDELAWAQEHCPDRFKTRNAVARATHHMVEYTAANEAGISIHDPDAFYGGQPPTMPLLARLGAVCGGISKFGSAMANAHGVCATPVGQPEHCAFVWSLGRGRRSASSSLFARLDNKNCEWDRTTRHGGSQMPWNQAPWALPLMEQCQASYAAHCRAERLLALAPLVPLVERADYLASVSAASPQHIGVWLARIACVRQQARAATVAAASAGLDAVRIASAAASNDPRPWMVAARQAVLATSSVDAVVSRARAVLVSECPERGDNLVKPDGSEWWCEQSTAWFQIDLGEPHRIASMRLHWWGHSVAATYAVLASTDGVAWTRQRSRADATDSGEALNNWHRLPGWDLPTRFVRVELADGRLDPWFSRYLIGLRCCELSGRPLDLAARAAALESPRDVLRAEMRLRLASPPPSHASAMRSADANSSEDGCELEEEEDDDDQDQAANEASWRSAAVSHLERLLDVA